MRWKCSREVAVGCSPAGYPDGVWAGPGYELAVDCFELPVFMVRSPGPCQTTKVWPKNVPAFWREFPFGESLDHSVPWGRGMEKSKPTPARSNGHLSCGLLGSVAEHSGALRGQGIKTLRSCAPRVPWNGSLWDHSFLVPSDPSLRRVEHCLELYCKCN